MRVASGACVHRYGQQPWILCTIMQREQTWHVAKWIWPGTYIQTSSLGWALLCFNRTDVSSRSSRPFHAMIICEARSREMPFPGAHLSYTAFKSLALGAAAPDDRRQMPSSHMRPSQHSWAWSSGWNVIDGWPRSIRGMRTGFPLSS